MAFYSSLLLIRGFRTPRSSWGWGSGGGGGGYSVAAGTGITELPSPSISQGVEDIGG